MTDDEIEKLLKELKDWNAELEAQNLEAQKVLNKIDSEMKAEFPNGFKAKELFPEIYK
tara:strand:+ start:569 stop:742 length:174 start_codon:yes stop_codon:yes gene_type:complete